MRSLFAICFLLAIIVCNAQIHCRIDGEELPSLAVRSSGDGGEHLGTHRLFWIVPPPAAMAGTEGLQRPAARPNGRASRSAVLNDDNELLVIVCCFAAGVEGPPEMDLAVEAMGGTRDVWPPPPSLWPAADAAPAPRHRDRGLI